MRVHTHTKTLKRKKDSRGHMWKMRPVGINMKLLFWRAAHKLHNRSRKISSAIKVTCWWETYSIFMQKSHKSAHLMSRIYVWELSEKLFKCRSLEQNPRRMKNHRALRENLRLPGTQCLREAAYNISGWPCADGYLCDGKKARNLLMCHRNAVLLFTEASGARFIRPDGQRTMRDVDVRGWQAWGV
jgi:hypothetical protein